MTARDATPLVQWNVGSKINGIALSHDGTRVASASDDYMVRVWDVDTGALVLGPIKGHTKMVTCIAWSRDDAWIVSGSYDKTIRIWDAHTGDPIGKPRPGHTGTAHSVAVSPDNTSIVSGSDDGYILRWDLRPGALVPGPLWGHTGIVYSLAFSEDNTHIVSAASDKTIRIWDVRTGAPIGKPLMGHSQTVLSAAFSPDSTCIVSGSSDHTIRIWDVRTGAPIGEPLTGHTGMVLSVAFSPDSTRIVSGSVDGTIRIWNAGTGAPIGEPLDARPGMLKSVTFSPDNTRIVSGLQDGTIAVWEAPQSTLPSDIVAGDMREPLYDVVTSELSEPSFDMVTSNMSAEEMFVCLVKHGCADLSSIVDPTRYSSSAIASGGFGDVWQAWMNNDILVAVKCLRLHSILEGDLKGMKRTTRELHHWSKARHENIQELLGIVMFQDRLGMVSLWMANGNLQQYIEKNPDVERYPLCVQVAQGVTYLHGIGMVHGDLKALNVLVSGDGVAKISDFDYSTLSESTLRFSQTTKTGGGTLRWMAPELLLRRGGDDEDEDKGEGEDNNPPVMRTTQTDVYALGMTMFEIISGKVPYHQYSFDVGIFRALENKQPPKRPKELSGPDDQSQGMWALLRKCWDHDPSARPEASSVLASLQNLTV